MTTIKASIFKKQINSSGKCNIKIRITHNRRLSYLSTNFYIEPEHFNYSSGLIKPSHPNHAMLNIKLKQLSLEAEEKLLNIKDVNQVDVSYLKSEIKKKERVTNVYKYIDNVIQQFESEGKVSSKESYTTLKTRLTMFHPSPISFRAIDYKFLSDFFADMLGDNCKINTTAVMFRNLRAVYNRAINEGLVGIEYYPFRKFKIKTERPVKKNLHASIIYTIATSDLPEKYRMSRDIFMLSFYLAGMNLVDMFELTKDNIVMDRLDYQRRKTKQPISMMIPPEARDIIDKYLDNKRSKRLLNFHVNYNDSRYLNKRVNNDLKHISKGINIRKDIRFYFARHSYASIGISLGINRDVIGKSLSHSSGSVTDVYTSYDSQIIDQANRKIIDHVKSYSSR